MGRLVLDVSTTSFFEVLSTYNNAFTDNAAALIRFSDSGYLPLAPQGLDESLLKINAPFSLTPYSQTGRSTYICNHPLERFGLCVQMLNSLHPITQKSGIMASVLAGIFFIASVLVPWGITAYSKYLTRHLEKLNGKIQGFLKDEGINDEGEALSQ